VFMFEKRQMKYALSRHSVSSEEGE
jgi:hypothetical protein